MKTIKNILEISWKDPKMVNYCLESTTYLNMGDYYLKLLDKPSMTKTIYYADTDCNTGKMAKDPGTSWDMFKKHNMRLNSPKHSIERIEKDRHSIILQANYNNDKTNGLLKCWTTKRAHEVMPEDRVATEEETKAILKGLKVELKIYKKRLKTYYKRYSKHIRTSSYWAER